MAILVKQNWVRIGGEQLLFLLAQLGCQLTDLQAACCL